MNPDCLLRKEQIVSSIYFTWIIGHQITRGNFQLNVESLNGNWALDISRSFKVNILLGDLLPSSDIFYFFLTFISVFASKLNNQNVFTISHTVTLWEIDLDSFFSNYEIQIFLWKKDSRFLWDNFVEFLVWHVFFFKKTNVQGKWTWR